jgi:hypothetical protein
MACCFVVLGAAALLHAEEAAFPGPGVRVRIRSGGADALRLVGTVSAVDQERLSLVPEGSGAARVVALHDIVRLERSVSPSRRRTGAWIGFGVGFAAAFGKVAARGGCNDGCDLGNVLMGGLAGAAGATAGAIIAPGEDWAEVAVAEGRGRKTDRPAGLKVRVVPRFRQGIGVSVVASF